MKMGTAPTLGDLSKQLKLSLKMCLVLTMNGGKMRTDSNTSYYDSQ